jgi:HD-GYP domain-containing protein (c-di-GMP phosphodiesterase class II)
MVSGTGIAVSVQAPCIPGYCLVPSGLLAVLGGCRCDLFKPVSWSTEPALYCSANAALTAEQTSELTEDKSLFLYVRQGDSNRLQTVLRENLDQLSGCEEIALEDRYNLVQTIACDDMKRLFQLIHLDGKIDEIDNLGNNISNLVLADATVPSELLDIARHNTDAFTHLVNVSAYCVLTARMLGISDEEELKAIAKGGLLHDFGKRSMPRKLLNKITSFDPEEKKLLRSHTQKGYEELSRIGGLSFGQLMMVYQHHERIDGKGYPVCIIGEEMHLWAKICAVADVIDALTGTRPYRKPESLDKVVEYLGDAAGTHFDAEIVECWNTITHAKS